MSPAHAADPPAAPASQADRAADLYKRATDLYREKKLADAEKLYLEAWSLQQTYDIATNLGAVDLDLKKYREAATYLAFALRTFPARGKQEEREMIAARLLLAKAEIVTLRVRVNLDKADITVNGKAVGVAPIADELFADAGSVTVEATRDHYEPAKQTFQGKKGEEREVTLELVPAQTAQAERSKVPAFVLGGAALASVAAGAGLLGAYAGKRDEVSVLHANILAAKRSCVVGASNFDARCKDVESAARTGDDFNKAGIGLAIGGGALAAGAVGYWLWARQAPQITGIRFTPIVTDVGGGLVAAGTW